MERFARRYGSYTPSIEDTIINEINALKYDRWLLMKMRAWNTIFFLRNYKDEENLRTEEKWEHLDRLVLGATLSKPFTLHPFQFIW